jgi:hypothetical protein
MGSDTWGHNIVAYNDVTGKFDKAEFIIMEKGPERAALQVKSYYGKSFIAQNFYIYKNSAELSCMVTRMNCRRCLK